MNRSPSAASFDTIVIGAGQAGLAAGYYLARHRHDFVILDAHARVGDNWRNRWDSLRLFTPAAYSSLPGHPFPAEPDALPLKDEVGDYLEAYARRFDLPVRLETPVTSLARDGDAFVVQTPAQRLTARHVIVATGAFQAPRRPPFAGALDAGLTQVHSSTYRNPDQLPPGPVLVVGAGNSGAQIAIELAASREVYLSGPDVGRLPRRLLGRDIYRWIWPTLLQASSDTWLGRTIRTRAAASGDPLIGIDLRRDAPPGLRRVGRTVEVQAGKPVLDSGDVLDVAAVVWCTGFRPDFGWIHLDVFEASGYPRHRRGVVEEVPGLYFVGLRLLHRLSSSLIGGVGRDAAHVVAHLTRT